MMVENRTTTSSSKSYYYRQYDSDCDAEQRLLKTQHTHLYAIFHLYNAFIFMPSNL